MSVEEPDSALSSSLSATVEKGEEEEEDRGMELKLNGRARSESVSHKGGVEGDEVGERERLEEEEVRLIFVAIFLSHIGGL